VNNRLIGLLEDKNRKATVRVEETGEWLDIQAEVQSKDPLYRIVLHH